MKTFIKFLLLASVAVIFIQATCGVPSGRVKKPAQVIKFTDNVYYHNMSITYDGEHYYTINGGNEGYCSLNEYNKKGKFIYTYDVEIDGRAIFYNPKDGSLYVKDYSTDLYVVDLEYEYADFILDYVFEEDNNSPAASPDGNHLFELVNGLVTVMDFESGTEIRSFRISDYYDEFGYNSSIAVSDRHLFAWADEDEIVVYDLNGKFIKKLHLPRSGYKFSLSFCNGLLWIAEDADASTEGGDGYWYGYDIY